MDEQSRIDKTIVKIRREALQDKMSSIKILLMERATFKDLPITKEEKIILEEMIILNEQLIKLLDNEYIPAS